jgi:hypothetical protein
MLFGLNPILLGVYPAKQDDGELILVLLLPTTYLRQEGVAGTAARVGEEQHNRLAGGTY